MLVCQYTIYGETNAKVDYVLVISQYEYDISVITRVRGEAEDECS